MLVDRKDRAVFGAEIRRRGRRPSFGAAATVAIVVRVTESQREDLRKVAQINQTNISGAIRDAVDGYVSDFRDDSPVFRR